MLRVSSPLTESDEQIVTSVVDCAYTVHKILGPGFREKIYGSAFASNSSLAAWRSSVRRRFW
jgi:PD-(D/E)XK nuclease superfamily